MEEMVKMEKCARAVAIGWVVAAVFLAAMLAPSALWAGSGGGRWEQALGDLDTDQDGVVSREEFAQRVDPFARLDHNGDGVLSLEDREGGPGFGRPQRGTGVASLVGLADADRDGAVSADEWSAYLDNLHSIFAELDQDGDGRVSSQELPPSHGVRGWGGRRRPGERGRGEMTPGEMTGIMLSRVADSNRDGEVVAGEWRGLLSSLEVGAEGVISEENLRALLPMRPGRHRGLDRTARLIKVLDRNADGVLEIADLEAAFSEVDQDGDGALLGEEVPRSRRWGSGPPRF